MATFLDIKTRVLRRLIDAPPAITAEIGELVNDALREVQDRFNFPWMRTTVSFTTAAGTHTLGATPTDLKCFRERPYWIENTQGRVHKFPPVRAKEPALNDATDQQIGPPRALVQDVQAAATGTSSLLVYPLSDSASDYTDGQYRIVVPYYKYLSEFSSDGDSNVATLDRRLVRFMVDWATKLGHEMNWDAPKAEQWATLAEKEWIKIKGKEGEVALMGLDVLVPHQGADDPRMAE
jgi:hypothetical protein